jgi:hypothetical protein
VTLSDAVESWTKLSVSPKAYGCSSSEGTPDQQFCRITG